MVTRTFLSNCTTIFEDSEDNFGLNPVIMLNKGLTNSRALVYFDVDKISQIAKDNTRHILTMYNCGSLDKERISKRIGSEDINGEKVRATSFTLVAFRVPTSWDRGCGFDHSNDKWFIGDSAVSTQGCNWYQAEDGKKWLYGGIYPEKNPAKINRTKKKESKNDYYIDGDKTYYIESIETLAIVTYGSLSISIEQEYEKYLNGKDSIIVADQHFSTGTEDLHLDLTDYVNGILSGKYRNNGLCLMFAPSDSINDVSMTRYVGFFSDKTNTFYEPILESRNNDTIEDNRNTFTLGVTNKLYLYANSVNGGMKFDELPVCTINGESYPVTEYADGVYYATVNLNNVEPDTILVDEWSNLILNGTPIESVEQEFVVHNNLNFGAYVPSVKNNSNEYVTVSGIKNDEKISQDDERVVEVMVRKPYTGLEIHTNKPMFYRLYVKDAYREVDVIDWDNINILPDTNYFTIDASGLLPQEYHVDIKLGPKIIKDKLRFKIVNNITSKHV